MIRRIWHERAGPNCERVCGPLTYGAPRDCEDVLVGSSVPGVRVRIVASADVSGIGVMSCRRPAE